MNGPPHHGNAALARRRRGACDRPAISANSSLPQPARSRCRAVGFKLPLLERLDRPAEALALLESLPEPDWGDARALYLLTRVRMAAIRSARSRATCCAMPRSAAESYRLLRQIDSAWRQWAKRDGGELKPLRIAFAGTVTADFLFPALRADLFADGLSPEIWNAPFGQYQQVILGDDPALREFKPDLVVFATDWRSAAQASSRRRARQRTGIALVDLP